MKKFLTIKEFSTMSGIESSTLRYWDEIGLFSPAKRDEHNNYRYYAPDQLIAVNFFTVLSNLNVPIKTISASENERSPESIMEVIDNQENILDIKMRELRDAYSVIHTRRELIKQGLKTDVSKISVVNLPERFIITGPKTRFKEGEKFYEPFVDFCDHAKELRINLSYPIGGSHENFDNFLKAPGEPDNFFSLDPMGNTKVPAGEYLVGYNNGYYGEFGDLPKRLLDYIKENNLTLKGPLYSVYLYDEVCIEDPSKYVVCVSIAVDRK